MSLKLKLKLKLKPKIKNQMSARNKRQNKVIRRDEREMKGNQNRQPVGAMAVTVDEARGLLTDPKQKIGAAGRRFLKRVLANQIVATLTVPKIPAVRLAEKLATLTLSQVIRRRSQFAARAAGAKYKLAALTADSKFRPPLQRFQDLNLFAMMQAQAELDARKLHALKKLSVESTSVKS